MTRRGQAPLCPFKDKRSEPCVHTGSDSGIEPRQWYTRFRIDGYVYYVISLEEDTPPNANAPIYVKIAKNNSYATHIR